MPLFRGHLHPAPSHPVCPCPCFLQYACGDRTMERCSRGSALWRQRLLAHLGLSCAVGLPVCRGAPQCLFCVSLLPRRVPGAGWGQSSGQLQGPLRLGPELLEPGCACGWGCQSGAHVDGAVRAGREAAPSSRGAVNTRWGWQPAQPGTRRSFLRQAFGWATALLGCQPLGMLQCLVCAVTPCSHGGSGGVFYLPGNLRYFLPCAFAGGTEALQEWLRISPAVLYNVRSCFLVVPAPVSSMLSLAGT